MFLSFLYIPGVLVHPMASNTIRCLLNSKHLFLTVLETGKSKIKALAFRYLVRAHFPDGRLLSVTLLSGQGKLALWGLLNGLHPHDLSTSQRLRFLIPSPWGLRGNTDFQTIAPGVTNLLKEWPESLTIYDSGWERAPGSDETTWVKVVPSTTNQVCDRVGDSRGLSFLLCEIG